MARLLALLHGLPPEGALARALGQWWTPDMELVAQVIEVLWAQFRQLVALGGASRSEIPRPFTYPRPGRVLALAGGQESNGAATIGEYRRMFAGRG